MTANKPKVFQEFKGGDYVYIPKLSTAVHLLTEYPDYTPYYPIEVRKDGKMLGLYTRTGFESVGDMLPSLFLATPENKAAIEKFYGITMDDLPVGKLTSKYTRELLGQSHKPVLCFVSDTSDSDSIETGNIKMIVECNGNFKDTYGLRWHFAVPVGSGYEFQVG